MSLNNRQEAQEEIKNEIERQLQMKAWDPLLEINKNIVPIVLTNDQCSFLSTGHFSHNQSGDPIFPFMWEKEHGLGEVHPSLKIGSISLYKQAWEPIDNYDELMYKIAERLYHDLHELAGYDIWMRYEPYEYDEDLTQSDTGVLHVILDNEEDFEDTLEWDDRIITLYENGDDLDDIKSRITANNI